MGGSAADTVMGGSAAGGPQVVQQSCMGTAVLHNLCGSAAVANYSSHHPNFSKHDGSCSFATAVGLH